ncbi:hypothetical protein HN51_021918 [Arachis hypogaea]
MRKHHRSVAFVITLQFVFAVHRSPFAVAVRRPPFTVRCSPFTVHRPPHRLSLPFFYEYEP